MVHTAPRRGFIIVAQAIGLGVLHIFTGANFEWGGSGVGRAGDTAFFPARRISPTTTQKRCRRPARASSLRTLPPHSKSTASAFPRNAKMCRTTRALPWAFILRPFRAFRTDSSLREHQNRCTFTADEAVRLSVTDEVKGQRMRRSACVALLLHLVGYTSSTRLVGCTRGHQASHVMHRRPVPLSFFHWVGAIHGLATEATGS
jgi:hypothetical protein